MMNTSYVPLEHPYQIIECNGTLGIQIGTLIVTVDKTDDKGYAIETHSHPVVSYVNSRLHVDKKHRKTYPIVNPYEGVVWDKVELSEVNMLTRENETMSWRKYMDFCRRVRMYELKHTVGDANIVYADAYRLLESWGVGIESPKGTRNQTYELSVELVGTFEINDIDYLFTGGDLGIVVGAIDEDVAVDHILKQTKTYLMFMEHIDLGGYGVRFWTGNLFMQRITEKLNKRIRELYSDGCYYMTADEEDEEMPMAAEDPNY